MPPASRHINSLTRTLQTKVRTILVRCNPKDQLWNSLEGMTTVTQLAHIISPLLLAQVVP